MWVEDTGSTGLGTRGRRPEIRNEKGNLGTLEPVPQVGGTRSRHFTPIIISALLLYFGSPSSEPGPGPYVIRGLFASKDHCGDSRTLSFPSTPGSPVPKRVPPGPIARAGPPAAPESPGGARPVGVRRARDERRREMFAFVCAGVRRGHAAPGRGRSRRRRASFGRNTGRAAGAPGPLKLIADPDAALYP